MFAGLAFEIFQAPQLFFEWVLWIRYIFIGWQAPYGEWLLLIPIILYIFLTKNYYVLFVEGEKLEASGKDYKIISNKLIPSFLVLQKIKLINEPD